MREREDEPMRCQPHLVKLPLGLSLFDLAQQGQNRGVFNVPYISSAYLISSALLCTHKPKYDEQELEPEISFCQNYRENGVFLFVSNLDEYGHLVNAELFDVERTQPDMYELLTNRVDWERRYISPLYADNFNSNKTIEQPCPDVYWFPVLTSEFCQSLIEIMESFGQWSDGSNKDPRVLGGYENVPTRDVHLKQVGLEAVYHEFLTFFISPLQQLVFIGYNNPPRSLMNFVVRYKPEEQPSLKPHHDSSTYTINIALNKPNEDYKGGGCRFLRYNCSVVDTRVGWLLMHPGRLTHFHEGLPVTSGTRYIMVSFIDP